MELFYMRDPATGNHHSGPDEEGVIIHYPSTCNVQDLASVLLHKSLSTRGEPQSKPALSHPAKDSSPYATRPRDSSRSTLNQPHQARMAAQGVAIGFTRTGIKRRLKRQ